MHGQPIINFHGVIYTLLGVNLEYLTVPQLVRKSPVFYGADEVQNAQNTNTCCGFFRTRFRSSDRRYLLVPTLIIIWLPPNNESRGLPSGI